MLKMEHRCKILDELNQSVGFRITIVEDCPDPSEQKDWYLTQESLANQKGVSCGEAAIVGEVLSECSLLIYYCPFCGQRLT